MTTLFIFTFFMGLWGICLYFIDHIEETMWEPLYDALGENPKKNVWKLLGSSILFSIIHRLIYGAPIWGFLFLLIQFIMEYPTMTTLKICLLFAVISGIGKAGEIMKRYTPSN